MKMNNKITCIALFENEDLNKIENIVSILDDKLCKVPLFIEDREKVDTLPYHTTLSVWDIEQQNKVTEVFKNINMQKIELEVSEVKVKKGYFTGDESWNLYLAINENSKLREIQDYIYQNLPNEKYNPETFIIHITLHCDSDYEKLNLMKEKLMRNFIPFKIKFNKLGLFVIYPVKKVL